VICVLIAPGRTVVSLVPCLLFRLFLADATPYLRLLSGALTSFPLFSKALGLPFLCCNGVFLQAMVLSPFRRSQRAPLFCTRCFPLMQVSTPSVPGTFIDSGFARRVPPTGWLISVLTPFPSVTMHFSFEPFRNFPCQRSVSGRQPVFLIAGTGNFFFRSRYPLRRDRCDSPSRSFLPITKTGLGLTLPAFPSSLFSSLL